MAEHIAWMHVLQYFVFHLQREFCLLTLEGKSRNNINEISWFFSSGLVDLQNLEIVRKIVTPSTYILP